MTADEIVMRCATCGKPKPDDSAWARTATCCGESRRTSSLTFTETPATGYRCRLPDRDVSSAASYRDARGAVLFHAPRHIYRLAVWLGGKLQDLGYAVFLWGWRDRG